MPAAYSSIAVYGQVSKSTPRNYRKLTEERNSRFRVVETRKTFISKFINRQQKPGEKVEDYAADLKRLYEKEHPKRNSKTREDDLLQRLLDSLADSIARFHVENVKEPENIDVVTIQVVNFEDIGRGQKNKNKTVRQTKGLKTGLRDETFKKFSKGGQTKNTANQTENQKKNNELQVQLRTFSEELDIHEYKKQYATKENNETSADNRSKEPQQLTSH